MIRTFSLWFRKIEQPHKRDIIFADVYFVILVRDQFFFAKSMFYTKLAQLCQLPEHTFHAFWCDEEENGEKNRINSPTQVFHVKPYFIPFEKYLYTIDTKIRQSFWTFINSSFATF